MLNQNVLGIKLHITATDAEPQIVNSLHLPFKFGDCNMVRPVTPCIRKRIAFTPGRTYVSEIEFWCDRFSVRVTFSPTFPYNSRSPEKVVGIHYQIIQTQEWPVSVRLQSFSLVAPTGIFTHRS